MFPGAAAGSSLALNGHRVNPLKVHPPAAVTGQSGNTRKEEKEGKRQDGSEKEKCGRTVLEPSCRGGQADRPVKTCFHLFYIRILQVKI